MVQDGLLGLTGGERRDDELERLAAVDEAAQADDLEPIVGPVVANVPREHAASLGPLVEAAGQALELVVDISHLVAAADGHVDDLLPELVADLGVGLDQRRDERTVALSERVGAGLVAGGDDGRQDVLDLRVLLGGDLGTDAAVVQAGRQRRLVLVVLGDDVALPAVAVVEDAVPPGSDTPADDAEHQECNERAHDALVVLGPLDDVVGEL